MSLNNETLNIIDINDSNSITLFGADIQKKLAELSGRLLKSIEETEVDDMTNSIDRTVGCLDDFSQGKIEKKGIFRLFKKNNAYTEENRKQDVIKQVENMETVLDKYRVKLLMDSAMFDQLYKMNMDCVNGLEQKIQVAKTKKEELLNNQIGSHGADSVINNVVAILDNRIKDLELSLVLSAQQTTQIGLLRESTSAMAIRIQGTLYNVIPLWKNQICSNANSETKNAGTSITEEIIKVSQTLIRSLGEIAHIHETSKIKKREAGLVLGNKG